MNWRKNKYFESMEGYRPTLKCPSLAERKGSIDTKFISLWNQKQQNEKEQYKQLYEELEHTKQELEVERKKKKSTTDRKRSGRSRSAKLGQVKEEEEDDEEAEREVGDDAENEEMMVNGAEDDLEGGHEPMPLHVRCSVAGRRLVPSNTSTILTANDTITATSLLNQHQAYEKRKNAAKEEKSKAKAAKKVARMELSDSDADDGRGESNGKARQRTKVTAKERETTTAKVTQKIKLSDRQTQTTAENEESWRHHRDVPHFVLHLFFCFGNFLP